MYPSTEMLISVQKYKLHYRKISPIRSTQITAPCIIYKVPTDFFQILKKIFFCTERFIFVLKIIFLYWDTYCCTVVYIYFIVLKNIVTQPMNMFVLEFMFFFLIRDWYIFFYWSCCLCTKNWRYLSVLEFIFLYWN